MKFWLSTLTWPVILSQITVLEFVNDILQSDLALLMILKFMLLCGYKNMAVNKLCISNTLQDRRSRPRSRLWGTTHGHQGDGVRVGEREDDV
ncbi:hypothetical protein ACQJBY_043875 [Aegilops geniculata]